MSLWSDHLHGGTGSLKSRDLSLPQLPNIVWNAFRTSAHVLKDDFQLQGEQPKTYTKIGGSGQPRIMAFCGNCGTQLYGTGEGASAKVLSLRIGTCDQRAELTPSFEIFRAEAVDWIGDLGVRESFDTGRR